MEGWLLLIKSNRFSLQNIRKKYFVLEDFHLKSFNSIPNSNNELPIGETIIDSCIRVTDNGRRNIHNKAFFLFTVYHTSNHKEQLKLGAKSPEEAARWIHSLKDSTSKKQCPHNGKYIPHFLGSKWESNKVGHPRRTQSSGSLDCLQNSSTHMDSFISRINTQSSWNIIGCVNGLRIFKEDRRGMHYQLSLHLSLMAVGVVDGNPEAIFETIMSLGSSRSEWDFCFYKDTVIEHLDDHTDIIHKILDKEWLPCFIGECSRETYLCNDLGEKMIMAHIASLQESLQPQDSSGDIKSLLQESSTYVFQEGVQVGDTNCKYGSTFPLDSSYKLPCSCAEADPLSFMIRGENYLRNQQKVKAKETMMQLVGADWLKSNSQEDDLARRPGGIVQKYAAQGGSEFFIVINMQVPGPTTYNLALYYMTRAPLEDNKLLERFVNGDEDFRNSRFKLTPYISKGSWIVKQSVKRKPCLLCKALQGKNYLEMDVDIGSSKVARSVVNLVLGYVNNLVIELAFLIQANTKEELPECLIGTCRLNHVDVGKAVNLRLPFGC